jgi:hypothetical protein
MSQFPVSLRAFAGARVFRLVEFRVADKSPLIDNLCGDLSFFHISLISNGFITHLKIPAQLCILGILNLKFDRINIFNPMRLSETDSVVYAFSE